MLSISSSNMVGEQREGIYREIGHSHFASPV
jgi:hypothetical protein